MVWSGRNEIKNAKKTCLGGVLGVNKLSWEGFGGEFGPRKGFGGLVCQFPGKYWLVSVLGELLRGSWGRPWLGSLLESRRAFWSRFGDL